MSPVKKQAAWTFASSLVAAVLQIIQLAVLARVLNVESLGILAIVQIFIAIAFVFQDVGLSNFHIHKQQSTNNQLSTLFIISFILGVLVAAFTWLMAPIVAGFYQHDQISALLELLAIQFILLGATALYQAEFIKKFRQVGLAKIEILCRFAAFSLTLLLLLRFELGLQAVVIGLLAGSALKMSALWYFSAAGFHPWYRPDWSIMPQAWRYGYFQFLAQFINQFRSQADQLIIGKLLGMELLGFYSLAKELILKPGRFIQPLIQRLLMPRFAKNQDNKQQQHQLYHQTIAILSWSNSLLFGLIALLALPIVIILYGSDFLLTAVLISILALFGMVRPIGAVFASIAQANGRTDIEFKWNIVAGITMLLVVIAASISKSVIIVAVALSAVQTALTIAAHYFFNHYLQTGMAITSLKKAVAPYLLTFCCAITGIVISTAFG